MEKRITKKDMFGEIRKVAVEIERQDIIDFVDKEIELLNRKSSRSTQSKTQIENENIKVLIVNALTEVDKPVTISELQELNSEMGKYSNQKLSALLKQLVESKEVVRTSDKKKAYFSVEM